MKVLKTKYPGIYQIGRIYYVDFYGDGKRHRKAVGPNLLIALEEKTRLKRRDKRGKYQIVERMERTTFRQLLELYKREGEAKNYILQFEPVYLKHFGDRRLSTITRSDLFAFKDKVKTTPKQNGGKEVTDATVNRALAGLRRLFNFAVFRQYLEENPFPKAPKSGLFYSEKKGLRLFFTEDQVEKILEASPPWLKPMVLTAYYTGMREGELLGLQREWMDLKAGIIYLPSSKTLKDPTGQGQMIVMPKDLIDLIESLPKKSEYVFCQPNGEPYRQWHVYKAFKKVLKAVGIDSRRYSWKELRHSTASQMHLKGVEVTAIKDQLRHSSSRTTENFYIGSDVSYQREQIEKLSNERFRGFLTGSEGNSEKNVKKEPDFETLQEVPPIATA